MKQQIKDIMFNDALNILSTNQSKVSSLRLFLLNKVNFDSELNLQIRKYLAEFEYDLKLLYDFLKNIKSYIYNNIKESNNFEQDQKKNYKENPKDIRNLKKSNSLKLFNKYKEKPYLNENNDYDNSINIKEKPERKIKQYNLTINICDDRNLNYIPSKEYNRTINRSNSCKSYLGFKKTYKFDLLNNDIQNMQKLETDKNPKFRNYLNNDYSSDTLSLEFNYNDMNFLKNNKSKLNHKYNPNLTDYSSNKLNKRNNSHDNIYNYDNKRNKEILNNENNFFTFYNNESNDSINNNLNTIENNTKNIKGKNNNNTLNLEETKNHTNLINNFISPKENNDNDNDNIYENYKKKDYSYNSDYFKNKYNYIWEKNNNKKDLKSNMKKNKKIEPNMYYNKDFEENNYKNNNLKFDINENQNYNNYINQLSNLDNNSEEEEKFYEEKNKKRNKIIQKNYINNEITINEDNFDEDKKKEIIRSTITLVLQDSNRLNELKRYLGDDIGEKLLRGNINQKTLLKIIEVMKSYQTNLKNNNKNDKNLFRGSKNNYKNWMKKKLSLQNEMLLKNSLNNKGCSYKEFPLGLMTMKDHFNNNEKMRYKNQ